MSAIDQAKKHFSAKEIKELAVPEWGDENGPLIIYSDPVTLAEKNRVSKRADRDKFEALAFAIILKAKDSSGEKLFTIKDKHDLIHKVDPDVLTRVAAEVMEVDDEEVTEKN